jgi:ABC-type transport system involved in cytochrome bd biosynthesis fused ATPase/permease subunit
MCEPVTITTTTMLYISLATAAASAAASFMMQKAATDKQNAQRAQTRKNAVSAYENQIKQSVVQEDQDDQSVALKLTDAKIKGAQAEATALVAAGESGIGGNSVVNAISDFNAQEGRYESAVLQQSDFDSINRQFQLEGMQAQAAGRVQAASPVSGPSAGLALLDFGSSAVGSYSSFSDKTSKGG